MKALAIHLKGSRRVAPGVLVAMVCMGCTKVEAPPVGAPEGQVRVEQELEAAQTCRIQYGYVNREAPCDSVGRIMLTELRIPTRERVVIRPLRTANYEQVGRMLQSMQDAGYTSIGFPSH